MKLNRVARIMVVLLTCWFGVFVLGTLLKVVSGIEIAGESAVFDWTPTSASPLPQDVARYLTGRSGMTLEKARTVETRYCRLTGSQPPKVVTVVFCCWRLDSSILRADVGELLSPPKGVSSAEYHRLKSGLMIRGKGAPEWLPSFLIPYKPGLSRLHLQQVRALMPQNEQDYWYYVSPADSLRLYERFEITSSS